MKEMKELLSLNKKELSCAMHDGLGFYHFGEYKAFANDNLEEVAQFFEPEMPEELSPFGKRFLAKMDLEQALSCVKDIAYTQRFNDSYDMEMRRCRYGDRNLYSTNTKCWIDKSKQAPILYDQIGKTIRNACEFAYYTRAEKMYEDLCEKEEKIKQDHPLEWAKFENFLRNLEGIGIKSESWIPSYETMMAIQNGNDILNAIIEMAKNIDITKIKCAYWNTNPTGKLKNLLDLFQVYKDAHFAKSIGQRIGFNSRVITNPNTNKWESWLFKVLNNNEIEDYKKVALILIQNQKIWITISRLGLIMAKAKRKTERTQNV